MNLFNDISACRQFDQAHTGENIANMLFKIMLEFGIEKKVQFVLSDGAANMRKGI